MSSRLPTVEEEALLDEEDVLTDFTTATPPAPSAASAASAEPTPKPASSSAVDTLAELFPNHSHTALERAVAAYPNNLDAAATMLATAGSAGSTSGMETTEEADYQFARALQAAESGRRVERARLTTPSPRHLNRIVEVLRNIVVPALHAHFRELAFDDLSEESGAVRYAMRDVRVVALSLPAENIIVRIVGRQVRVQVVNMFLQIAVGHWRYESKGILGWKDSGKMEASVNGLSAIANLTPRENALGAVNVKVHECEVGVEGAVKIRTEGTAADWAYNTMAVLFKPLIVSYIKDAVADLVRVSLASQLRDWTYAIEPDQPPVFAGPSIGAGSSQPSSASDGTTTAAS